MADVYIYSSIPEECAYAIRRESPSGASIIDGYITIKGGAQLATQWGNDFVTPLGTVTKITEKDLELLKQDWTFNHRVQHGQYKIDSVLVDVEKAVTSDMYIPSSGESVPITDQDLAAMDKPEGVDISVIEGNKRSRKVA